MPATVTTHLLPAGRWLNFLPPRDNQSVKDVISYYATALSARTTRYGCCSPTPTKRAPSVETSTGPFVSLQNCTLSCGSDDCWGLSQHQQLFFHVFISARRSKLRRNIMLRDTRSLWILALHFPIVGFFFVVLSYAFTTIDWQLARFICAFYGRDVYTGEGSAWYTRHGPFNDTFGSSLGHHYDSSAATTHRRLAC